MGGGGGGAGGAFGGGSAIGFSGAGGFDPVAGFSFSWNQSTTPLGITIVQGVPVVTTHTSNYSVSVGQSLPTGTSFGINFFAARQSTTGVTSIFNPQIPTQMAVGFTQPLLNGFGRRVNERFIRIAGNEVRIADSKFREKLIATVAQVSTLYWDFVSFEENVEVARHSLSLAEKSLSENQKEVALGVLARIDAVQAASEVARRREDLIVAQARAHDQQEQLKTAISKQVDSELAAAEIVATDRLPEPKPDDIFALEAALRLAAKSRPEIEQADLNIRNQEITIKATRSGLLPSLNLFATYAPQGLSGNQGAGGRIVRAGFAESLSQTLHNTYPDYSLGVSLGIPLRNRAARADLARTLLEARQLETKLRQAKNQVEQDVRRAVVAVTEAKAEVEAAGEAVKLAGQMLDGEQEKFRLGQSDTFKVIQAQRDLATAEGAEVTAHSNYAKALVQFEQATGSILERNRIEISDATNPRLG